MEFFKESDCDITSYSEFISKPYSKIKADCLTLKQANALIRERGKTIYLHEPESERFIADTWDHVTGYSHTALLINIEPIERDSAEKIVSDLLAADEFECDYTKQYQKFIDRAKKLRGGK